jgi:hypothetical protein
MAEQDTRRNGNAKGDHWIVTDITAAIIHQISTGLAENDFLLGNFVGRLTGNVGNSVYGIVRAGRQTM